MEVRFLHDSNAESPMVVTPSGITTLVREAQPQNAPLPMVVTLSGITTLVIWFFSVNSQAGISVTPSAMRTSLETDGSTMTILGPSRL